MSRLFVPPVLTFGIVSTERAHESINNVVWSWHGVWETFGWKPSCRIRDKWTRGLKGTNRKRTHLDTLCWAILPWLGNVTLLSLFDQVTEFFASGSSTFPRYASQNNLAAPPRGTSCEAGLYVGNGFPVYPPDFSPEKSNPIDRKKYLETNCLADTRNFHRYRVFRSTS